MTTLKLNLSNLKFKQTSSDSLIEKEAYNRRFIRPTLKNAFNIIGGKTIKNVNKILPTTDLTTEGIEPNPGPVQLCINCDNIDKWTLGLISYSHSCSRCLGWCTQAHVYDENTFYGKIHTSLYSWNKERIKSQTKLGDSFMSHIFKTPSDYDPIISYMEDVFFLVHGLRNAQTKMDCMLLFANYSKISGIQMSALELLLSIGFSYWSSIREYVQNSGEPLEDFTNQSLEEHWNTGKSLFGTYKELKNSVLYKKMHKLLVYLICLGVFKEDAINLQTVGIDKVNEAAIRRSHVADINLIEFAIETTIFVIERANEYIQTRDISVIFHSGEAYESWVARANKLMNNSKFLQNPEPLGINRFSFLNELKDLIEEGKGIVKFSIHLDKSEKIYVSRLLCELQLLESKEITLKSAQEPRKDPFAVLIHGSSSICKSQLKQILFYHYGKVFNLPTTSDYMYTRCPTDEYWSGFNSTQWCIVMDDIAFLKPNGEVDPTLKEMLQVKNSVPYTPPQAELENKGRTPVKAELLIGTTNTKHLNLHSYFACPFAIARRMSYVITAKIKPEFAKHKVMADSNKIPITNKGEYMNIWNFEISVPRPEYEDDRDNQRSKYVVIHMFEDINEMLAWYITTAKEHEINQVKAKNADTTMSQIAVCNKCYYIESKCQCMENQADESTDLALYVKIINKEQIPIDWLSLRFLFFYLVLEKMMFHQFFFDDRLNRLIFWHILPVITMLFLYLFPIIWIVILTIVSIIDCVPLIVGAYYSRKYTYYWKIYLFKSLGMNTLESYKFMMRLAGRRVKSSLGNNWTKVLCAIGCSTALIALAYNRLKAMNKIFSSQFFEGGVPVPKNDEKPTFYWQNPYAPTTAEISSQSKTAQGNNLELKIERNLAKIKLRYDNLPGKVRMTSILNVHGTFWLVHKHALHHGRAVIEVILQPCDQHVSRNVRNVVINDFDIVRIPDCELAVIKIPSLPPGPSLKDFFLKDKIISGYYRGEYFMRNSNGEFSKREVHNVTKGSIANFQTLGFLGKVAINTEEGDCGSPLLCDVNGAKVILGLHAAGDNKNSIYLSFVSQEHIEKLCGSWCVSAGVMHIDAPGYPRTLTDLHHKSTVRFIEQGTIDVMGSFGGYRPLHKSSVSKTYIRDDVVAAGYKDNCGKPDMSWKPWNIALEDMSKPIHTFENSEIMICADAFVHDILTLLDPEEIKQLQVYSQDVALNGVDGVTYVDMLNTSTSAGNPFKKSKKHFIEFDENNKINSLDPLIQDRIDHIENVYLRGERCHPQFCAHLKDEPVSKKKQMSGKTRVFTGAEFGWSVVVRKFLLSHIRLIQNNQFIFEAMPGVVAQSEEWEQLYKHITTFGTDTIVAGDYAKFDKRMAAPFILAAFHILEKLALVAGWSDEELRVIRCIAYDTAFPCIDYNGDLIEVQGNPSGHPLTVIINCLVNSLYVRYAYRLITKKDLDTFKDNVKLATYGDDNIMGINPNLPEFNHCSIAEAMKVIGVEYTMADKEAESIPYINIKDASFLKRTFKYDPDIGAVVAPLDHSSIDKMLTNCIRSKSLTSEAHAVVVIETALREYFFYGREIFEDRKSFFKNLVANKENLAFYVRDSTFPEYSTLVEEFWMRYKNIEKCQEVLAKL